MTQACPIKASWLQIDCNWFRTFGGVTRRVWFSFTALDPRRCSGWSCCSHLAIMRNLRGTHYILHSVQFSRSVMSDSLRPHESQHTRPPCPSPSSGVHSNSCPSSQWYHSAISSSVIPFSSCSQSLPVSESFPVSQLFAWGGQSTGASALASFLPKKSQGWSPSEWLDLLAVQGTLQSLLQHHSSKASILRCSAFFTVQLSHPYMTTGKTIALTTRTLVGKVMSLLLNILSRLVITFLPRSKCLLISYLQENFKLSFTNFCIPLIMVRECGLDIWKKQN